MTAVEVSITRSETFSAAHRLNSDLLSPLENVQLFGKCNNLHGHGHNYRLEVTIRGKIDPITGMVINMTDLKDLIKCEIFDTFDHKHLDLDFPQIFTSSTPSTTENFLHVISKRLLEAFPARIRSSTKTDAKITKITLWETDKNSFSIEF